jgi:hypothetical protein
MSYISCRVTIGNTRMSRSVHSALGASAQTISRLALSAALARRLEPQSYELSQEPCCFECCCENGRTTTDGEDLMYRKLFPLICAMLLSTAAFGQGGGGSGGGAGGAAGGGAAGSAGAGGGGTGATGGSTTGTGVNPTAPGSQYTNPTTGLPYSPSNSNDPNNPNSPNNPLSNPRPGSR